MNQNHRSFDRLDLNLLKVFEVVHREGSLSRAADVLSLTPSAVSHALRRLREHFGDPLFERVGHRMEPTPLCHRIADDIVLELARLRAVMQRWDRFDPLESRGRLTLGMPDALETMFLPSLVEATSMAAPGMSIVSAAIQRRSLAADLQSGQLDVAIDVTLPVQPGVLRAPLFRSDWSMVARSDHPAIVNPGVRSFEQARHIVVSNRSFGTVLEDQALIDQGVQRSVKLRTQTYASAIAALTRQRLILTAPRLLAEHLCRNRPGLRIAPTPIAMPDIVLFMYWHAHHEGDKRAIWIRETIRAVASAMLADMDDGR